MVQIRKKTGLIQSFIPEKIIAAVSKSAARVNVEFTQDKKDMVVSLVLEHIKDRDIIEVRDLHNIVEIVLDNVDAKIARSYREYRNYKLQFIKMMDDIYRKKLSLSDSRDTSNANADSSLVTTQKAITYAELNAELYKRFFLTEEENNAQEEGFIYVHDKGARLDTGNCFRRSTRFITSEGVKSFYDFNAGDTVTVMSHKGVWRNARVAKLAWGKLQRVWFKRGSGKETFVDCTPDHRWFLQDGTVTTNLKIGDTLYPVHDRTQIEFDSLTEELKKIWCLGFAFADGSIDNSNKEHSYLRIRLCGDKIRFRELFEKTGYTVKPIKDSTDMNVYMFDVSTKKLPYMMDTEKIRVFMNGYMSADGSRQLDNGKSSAFRGVSVTGDFNDFIYDFLNIAGYYVTRVDNLSGKDTNYGRRGDRSYNYGVYSDTGRYLWKVTRIEEVKLNSKANLWCLDVEEDHSFMLEKGIPTGNCCLFNMETVLKGGFHMGNIEYREPRKLNTAISLMTDVILNAGACQYGGFTVSEVDKLLAPYAKNSFDSYYDEYVSLKGSTEGAEEYALKKVRQEIIDGAIEVECRLNSTTTSRGDFIFSSLSFGLSNDRLGQMITSAFLEVRRDSLGTRDGIPVLFPKLTFLYDDDIHGKGKKLEWLFLEAVKCTQRAQYPDFLSMSGDGYAPSMYKKYGVTISRMGCVDGKSQVIYRDVYGDIHECCIEEMWEHLSKCFPVLSQESLGYSSGVYIDLNGVRIFDKDGFVDCSRIIKNTQNPLWYRVMLADGKKLVCTADHPWTTWFSNVSHVTQTKDLVPGDVVEVFFGLPSYTKLNDVVKESVSVQFVEISSIEIVDKEDVSYDVTTESKHFFCSGVRSHNCRANLSPWYERGGLEPADEDDQPRYEGRWNAGAISLNFPMIVRKSQVEGTDFWDELTYYLGLARKIHLRTLEFLSHKKAGINPLAFCEGGFYRGHKKPDEEIGKEVVEPCTVSFGISALNEATMMYKGKTLLEDKGQFAEEILDFINEYANKYKKEDRVLYALYGTPAESLCFCSGTLVQCYGGNREIQDIEEGDLVFSYNETLNKIELKPVVASSCTSKSASVVKVRFTNGQELVCTPNHPFAVRKRVGKGSPREIVSWVSAKDLTKGLRIKSNYVNLLHGRRRFTTYQYEHDVVAEYFFGEKPTGYVVHHIDENKLNNSVENLTYMKDSDHRRLHMKDTIRQHCYTSESQSGCKNSFYGKHHTKCSIIANRKAHLGKRNVASKEVAQYTLDDVLVNVFESRGRAESITGFKNISNACSGVSTNSLGCHVAYGFKWFYTKDVESFSWENHVVESVEVLSHKIPVFNIEVADNNNYFVGGDDGVLVHNCALQVQQFVNKYGVIKGVSDRKYMSNSFHVHVSEDITPIEKMDTEYACFHKCNGGNIIYNRFGTDYNTEAYVSLIREAMKRGFYYGCNISKNYCCTCEAEFLDEDKCPKCGSEDLVRISRVCGYLGLEKVHSETRMNEGKLDEIKDRKCM